MLKILNHFMWNYENISDMISKVWGWAILKWTQHKITLTLIHLKKSLHVEDLLGNKPNVQKVRGANYGKP